MAAVVNVTNSVDIGIGDFLLEKPNATSLSDDDLEIVSQIEGLLLDLQNKTATFLNIVEIAQTEGTDDPSGMD